MSPDTTPVDVAPHVGDAFAGSSSFEGPRDTILEQGVHALRHATLGELPPFVVPVQDLDVTRRSPEVVFQKVRT